MTVALRRSRTDMPMPTYAAGCRGGHRFLEFIAGECFVCGRGPEIAPQDRKAHVPTMTRAADESGWSALADAVEVTGLGMRTLAVLEDIDPLSLDEFAPWAAEVVDDDRLLEERLGEWEEHDVRWAIRAAAV